MQRAMLDKRWLARSAHWRSGLCLVVLALLAFGGTAARAESEAAALRRLQPLFDAIRHVETGGQADPAAAVGDGGRSIGPYQIGRAYWQDANVPGDWSHVRGRRYAERVMLAYWRRYVPEALAAGDTRVLARVHNGGPRGHDKRATLRYWGKVRQRLVHLLQGER